MNSSDDFPPDFQNYLNEEKYLCQEGDGGYRIFQAEGRLLAIDWAIERKIREVIKNYGMIDQSNFLCQFWKAVKMREDQYLLTTRQQPFSTYGRYCEGLYGYRQACRNYEYYVDNEAEEGRLGIPGRVFKYKSFEMSPDVIYYTIQEYPQFDEAHRYCIRQILAFPVFELSNKQYVGVFELITTEHHCVVIWERVLQHRFHHILKVSGLGTLHEHGALHEHATCPQRLISLDIHYWMKLKNALDEICRNPAIHIAQAWELCNDYQSQFSRDTTNIGYLGLLMTLYNKAYYGQYGFSWLMNHKREGEGVAGMALSSRKLSLCTEISQISIVDYSLKHYAIEYGWNAIFAICLERNHNRKNDVVLEFSLKYQGDVYTLLYQILKEMKKYLPSIRDSSGQELGEESPILLINSGTNSRHNFMPMSEARSKYNNLYQMLQSPEGMM
ncbi:hypothetical protein NMG60_11002387 [Bertholletia excelsa]